MKDEDGIDFEDYIDPNAKWNKMKFIIKKALEIDRIKTGIVNQFALNYRPKEKED